MVKKNPYKIATWVLVGILVLGGITGLIAFGNNNSSGGYSSCDSCCDNSINIVDVNSALSSYQQCIDENRLSTLWMQSCASEFRTLTSSYGG